MKCIFTHTNEIGRQTLSRAYEDSVISYSLGVYRASQTIQNVGCVENLFSNQSSSDVVQAINLSSIEKSSSKIRAKHD